MGERSVPKTTVFDTPCVLLHPIAWNKAASRNPKCCSELGKAYEAWLMREDIPEPPGLFELSRDGEVATAPIEGSLRDADAEPKQAKV